MCELSTREAFARLEDIEAVEAEVRIRSAFDRDQNLKIKAAQCAKIANRYGGINAVAVGVLLVQVADLVNCKVFFSLEEPVYNEEFKGERTMQDCWLDTKDASDAVQAVNAFYLQFWAVVDRNTRRVIALHNAG